MFVTTRRWRQGAITLAAGTVFALAPAAAHAATLNLDYDAVGVAHIASTDNDINLGPSTLSTHLDTDTQNFTGNLPLPGTTTRFEVLGFIPVTADVAFVPSAPLTGKLTPDNLNIVATSTAYYHIRLSNIKIVGFPTFTGPHCRTVNPVSIPANTPAGQSFNLFTGGTLSGQFSIGNFQHCGLNTGLINLLIPGSGNTVTIQVSNGRIV
jgi:hypothetical protein